MNNFNFNLIDTSKGLGPFTYSWNQDGTLSGILYPNNTNLNITYHNKIQDNITLTKEGNTLFSADGGFDEKDRLTSEAIDITTPNGTISEDYSFSYDTLSRLSSMNYSSDNRTITYGYDGSVGDRLTSVNFSDTGTYNITYDTRGRIDYVTYPNNQGTEEYTYNDPRGRLSNITYPDGKSLSFSWNSRGKLTQLTAVEGGTNTTFSFSYDGMNRISGYNKTTTKVGMPPQTEEWNFYYVITGIEKATRKQNGLQNLTIDYSTDTNGRILSAAYNETGGFSGELFAVPDNFGNIVAWTSILGINNYAAIYDPYTAYIDPREIHNPNDINVPLGWNGKKGDNITIQQVGTGNDLIFNTGCSGGFSITNPWGATDITDSTTPTNTDDTTDKDGGDDAEPCGPGECTGNCVDYDNMNCDQIKTEIEKGNCKPCGRGGDACRKVDECSNTVNNILKDWCHIGPVTKECYEKYNSTGMAGRSLGITNDINDKSNKYYKDAKNAFRYAYDKIGCSEI